MKAEWKDLAEYIEAEGDCNGHVYIVYPKVDPQVVKMISRNEPEFVKIGLVKSDDLDAVKRRVSQLQTGNPFSLEYKAFPCKNASTVEKFWHE